MPTLAPIPVQPEQNDVSIAIVALPHIEDYLARHHQQQVHVVVTDEHDDEPMTVPRSALELLARILAHMAVVKASPSCHRMPN